MILGHQILGDSYFWLSAACGGAALGAKIILPLLLLLSFTQSLPFVASIALVLNSIGLAYHIIALVLLSKRIALALALLRISIA